MSVQIVKLLDPMNIVNIPGGLVPKGAYNNGTSYSVGDSVSYNGSSYVCITASTGNLPTDTAYWQLVASKGDTGATGLQGPAGTTDYNELDNLPTLGTAAAKDIPATGNASATEVVYGTDTRLTDSRPASDVSAWAKAPTKPTYTNTEVGAAATAHTHAISDTTGLQTAIDGKQDADATLTALAAHNTNGILTQTAADTFTGRTITGTTNQITVTNGDGVSGNPTLSLPQNIHTGATPTFGSVTVTDDAYASGWNGSSVVPTKNAVYDKIEALNADKTSIDYIASRGPSLVTNGQALLGNNYNFSLYTLDKTDKPTGAAGSFVAPVGAGATNLDEFMAINPARIYEMSFAVRQAAGDGARVFYSYLAPYDIDKLLIEPYHYMEQAGTRTTLAAPLNPGDTTITLTSSANWKNAAGSSSHLRTVIVWNYVDGQGYAWPVGTYSRNSRMNSYNDGAISGNVITLSTPWNLPAAPAGTAISNGSAGNSYMYGAQAVLGPSTWTNYAYKYSGIHSNNAVQATTSFPIATAYVKAGFLRNYPTSSVDPTSIQKFANVALVDITEANNKLPLAGGTMTGTLVAPSYDVSGAKILSGTGFPEGVTTAPVGSIYIDKAITNGASSWIKKSGTGNTGWQVLEGDTGWRDIRALYSENVVEAAAFSLSSRIIRVGDTVQYLGRVKPSGAVVGVARANVAGIQGVISTIPAGFMPLPSDNGPKGSVSVALGMQGQLANTASTSRLDLYMSASVAGVWAGTDVIFLSGSWPTRDAWPTTLPGTAA